MKFSALMAAVLAIALVVGCQNKKKDDVAVNDSVTDIAPPAAPAYEPPPVQQPVAQQPVIYDTPVAPSSASAGGSYTVQKGDTLYGIARQRYGDGKQWQRIASANPGVNPQSLRVGQTLVIP